MVMAQILSGLTSSPSEECLAHSDSEDETMRHQGELQRTVSDAGLDSPIVVCVAER